jgi:hypothetical protein
LTTIGEQTGSRGQPCHLLDLSRLLSSSFESGQSCLPVAAQYSMPAFLDCSSKTAGARNVSRNPKSPENPLNIIVMGWQVK